MMIEQLFPPEQILELALLTSSKSTEQENSYIIDTYGDTIKKLLDDNSISEKDAILVLGLLSSFHRVLRLKSNKVQ